MGKKERMIERKYKKKRVLLKEGKREINYINHKKRMIN